MTTDYKTRLQQAEAAWQNADPKNSREVKETWQAYQIAMSTKGLGKYQRNMLDFITRCTGEHGINKDRFTQRVARSLVNRGLILLNEYGQIKLKI